MASEETEVIARIMATGFNRHIREHGPDGDYAGEATETGDGHGLVVTRRTFRDGFRVERQYGVRVEPLAALTAAGPMTPGQCWAALKAYLGRQIEQDLKVHQEALAAGDTATAASFGGLVSANRNTLAMMQELGGLTMSETPRIRWHETPFGITSGHVGTLDAPLFSIWQPPQASGEWVLTTELLGMDYRRVYKDDPEELKPEAELMLSQFIASLDALFPEGGPTGER